MEKGAARSDMTGMGQRDQSEIQVIVPFEIDTGRKTRKSWNQTKRIPVQFYVTLG
jgi:hypothetical protein